MTRIIIHDPKAFPIKDRRIIFLEALNQTVSSNFKTNPRISYTPRDFDIVELICKDYNHTGYDLIFASMESSRKMGTLYVGLWNDGIIE